MENKKKQDKSGYGYWFFCNNCGIKNTAARKSPLREQIKQTCNSCGKCSFYTRPGCRGTLDEKSWLYLDGETANTPNNKVTGSEMGIKTLPTKEDSEAAYRMLTKPGEAVSIDAVLDQIEVDAMKQGRQFKSDWRIITEKNIEIWASKPS